MKVDPLEDDFGLYFDSARADNFLSLLIGGMAKAQTRYESKLRTVDENGNPIDEGGKIDSQV